MLLKITKAHYLQQFQIDVEFNDGTKKVVDFSDLLKKNYPAFKPLKNVETFKNFIVTDTLEWDNGTVDIAPEYVYEIINEN